MIRVLSHIHALGPSTIAALCVYWGQRLGWGQAFLADYPRLYLSGWRQVFFCFTIFLVGHALFRSSTGAIWNRLTPVTDRETLIENEIIYVLSTLFGVGFICGLLGLVAIFDLPRLLIWVFIATLPAMAFAYALHKWIKKLVDKKYPPPAPDPSKKHIIPEQEDPFFWRQRLAFVIAAVVFNLVFEVILFSFVYIKTGQIYIPDRFNLSCLIGTFVLLTLFGSSVLRFGNFILTKLRAPVTSARVREAAAYIIGIALILAITLSLSLIPGIKQPNQPNVISWAGLLAFLVIVFCAAVAGTVLAMIRNPKIKPDIEPSKS